MKIGQNYLSRGGSDGFSVDVACGVCRTAANCHAHPRAFVNNILGGNPRFKDEVQGQQQRFRPARRPTPAEVGQQVIVDSTDQDVVEYEASTDKEKTKCLQH